MKWLRKFFLFIQYSYWRLMRMAIYIVVVREEFQIDEDENEIPETRIVRYCVKNTVEKKTIKCYPTLKEAKNRCDELNGDEDNNDNNKKSKPRIK